MSSYDELEINCQAWTEIAPTLNRMNEFMPLAMRQEITYILTQYLSRFGPEELLDRFNGRKVPEIIDEYKKSGMPTLKPLIAGREGEVDFRLYESDLK